ncbi:MAG: histidine kinase [Thiotrichales bacterium SG8_50]|nr:MAG: histidine kinase [Thiotrichales bacterium SG8_50]
MATVAGAVVGYPTWGLVLALAAYLVWHVRNLYKLMRWLERGKKFPPPEAGGLWGEVVSLIHNLQQRNRKRKKRLVKMLNRFRESTDALPDGTIVLDEQGTIDWWNSAAADLVGLNYPQDAHQRVVNLIRHPVFAEFLAKRDFSRSVEIPSPLNEERTLAMHVVAYGHKQYLLTIRDVTVRRQLEQIRSDFVANVSHELRTPLTVLSGYLEALGDGAEQDHAQVQKSMRVMQQQTRRMQHIVEDLLLLSRLENVNDAVVYECISVPEMLTLIREQAVGLSGDKGHNIELECDDNLWLRGEPKRIESAFSNLVANAVRYTPTGGDIHIRWFENEAGAHFQVQDTGVGIPAKHIPRLTERFYRVDVGRSRELGGTGLGLAIVKHVLNRHGATLEVASELERGSVFTCHFPPELILRRDEVALKPDQDLVRTASV